jgi:hypothetical protein
MILLTIHPVFVHMHTSLHNVNVKLDSTPDKAGHHPTHKMCQIGWRDFMKAKVLSWK